MASVDFLPPYLQTTANKRFLASTLDLLMNPPKITRFDGFIGRTVSNNEVLDGYYLGESTAIRQNYQLEAGFITRDDNNNITNTYNFLDLLNAAASKDAVVTNWNRLLTSNYYNWNGFLNIDKLTNYFNYIWVSTYSDAWYWNNPLPIGGTISEIIGQTTYTDISSGITLMNGMLIECSNNTYIVENVGVEINLVNTEKMISPNYTVVQNDPMDYITIERNCTDHNLWSMTNHWIPRATVDEIINRLTNTISNFVAPIQLNIANRPIIEFKAMILFGSNSIGLSPVTYFDNYTPNAFSIVEGAMKFECDGNLLKSGDTIIFNNDQNETIRGTVYSVFIDSNTGISLTPLSYASTKNCVLILNGSTFTNHTASWNGTKWLVSSQVKTDINQSPLFDVFDATNTSISTYNDSSFEGTKLFSYEVGLGANDPVLGFPLSYGNVGNLNDVIFVNNYDTDTFIYYGVTVKQNINIGLPMFVDPVSLETSLYDQWTYVAENLYLYQNYITIGTSTVILNNGVLIDDSNKPTLVYVNGELTTFTLQTINNSIVVDITSHVLSTDNVLVKVLSSTAITGAWYDVPTAFDHNPLNATLNTFNISEIRGNAIRKNEAFAMLPSMFLCNNTYDIDKAIRDAGDDYTLFKQKFITTLNNINNLNSMSVKDAVDMVLKNISATFTSSQEWNNSDMVPFGGNKTSYTITKYYPKTYNLKGTYDFSQPSSVGILVYVNNNQLIKYVNYSVTGSILTMLTPLYPMDVLDIYEISDTTGSHIPATPTKFGLAQKYIPTIYTDNTYVTPRAVIQGHDGSITTCYGDIRDNILLEYEMRVYNNLKVNNQLIADTIQTYLPDCGYWRKSPYALNEFNSILSRTFYEWASEYNVTYDNSFYDEGNYFTWNWSASLDKLSNNNLLGYWRGNYKWFFDTDSVNETPWEMLNLSIKPVWWDSTYGPSPYTGSNQMMWDDIANGIVRYPSGPVVSSFGPRPNISSIIPVDASGNLLDPNTAIVGSYNDSNASGDFSFGDMAPIENVWRQSSVYQFSLLRARILMNPTFMLGMLWDTNNYLPSNNWKEFKYKGWSIPAISEVIVDSSRNSVLNYSFEFLKKQSLDASKIQKDITNTSACLMYALGGFTDPSDITAYANPNNPYDVGAAELIPTQDFKLFLNKSVPVGTVNYSGVIITKTANGYQVSGYNKINPYFNIYSVNQYGPSKSIGVTPNMYTYPKSFSSNVITVPYNTVFYTEASVIAFLAGYEYYLISNGLKFSLDNNQSKISWSDAAIQFIKWALTDFTKVGNLSLVLNPSASILEYNASSGTMYDLTDTNVSSLLDVSGQLIDSKYLDVYREGNNVTITHQGGGVFACLNADIVTYEHRIVFDNTTAFSDVIYDPITGIRQLRIKLSGQKSADWDGTLSSPGFLICTDTVDTWEPNNDYLFGSLVTWKGINYIATQNIIGSSTFQYAYFQQVNTQFTNSILPNLSLKAVDYSHIYDTTYRPFITDLVALRNNTLGYIERDWLSGLDIDTGAQASFYSGWIKEKGTLKSIQNYGAGSTPELNTNLNVYEEYAIKVGVYGADNRTGYGEVSLTPAMNTMNPTVISFVASTDAKSSNVIQITENHMYEKSINWKNDFIQPYGNLKINTLGFNTGGPVVPQRILSFNEKTIKGFDVQADYNSTFFSNIVSMINDSDQINILKIAKGGGLFWIENNDNKEWDVITFEGQPTGISSVTNLNGNVLQLSLTSNISTTANSFIAIDFEDANISGVFRVFDYNVNPSFNGNVIQYSNLCIVSTNNSNLSYTTPIVSTIFTPKSLRISDIGSAITTSSDKVLFAERDEFGETSYELNPPYNTVIESPYIKNAIAINSIAYDSETLMAVVGKPTAYYDSASELSRGLVEVKGITDYPSTDGNVYPQFTSVINGIVRKSPNSYNLGNLVVATNGNAVVTASNISMGVYGSPQLYVIGYDSHSIPSINQILDTANQLPLTNIGIDISSMCMSSNSNWIYAISNNGYILPYIKQYNNNPQTYTITAIASDHVTVSPAISNEYDTNSIRVEIDGSISDKRILMPSTEITYLSTNDIGLNTSEFNVGVSGYVTTIHDLPFYYTPLGAVYLNGYEGSVIACNSDGSTIAVGVPSYNGNIGAVLVYNRTIENQIVFSNTNTITPTLTIEVLGSVSVNNVLLSPTEYYCEYGGGHGIPRFVSNIIFNSTIYPGSTVGINGNRIVLQQIILPPNSYDKGFGTSVALNNNVLIVGSIHSTVSKIYNSGAAYMYVLDTEFTTQKTIPLSKLTTVPNTFMINDWIITQTGNTYQSLVSDINNYSQYTGVSATIAGNNMILSIDSAYQDRGISLSF
jgi:hypothetical protein